MKLVKILALLGLLLASLTVPVQTASAAPINDCEFVPLTYNYTYNTGGETWKAKASLKAYDLCEEGTIRGKVYIQGVGDTEFGDLAPYRPFLFYRTQSSNFYDNDGVSLVRKPVQLGWRPYNVTTDDIPFVDEGYFFSVRIAWQIKIGNQNYIKYVQCDRRAEDGPRPWSCRKLN